MTQEEIIQLAMEYGFTGGFDAEGNLTFDATFVEAVAEAVAKTRKATLEEMIYEHPTTAIKKAVEYEREACAKEADKRLHDFTMLTSNPPQSGAAFSIANAIRARGEA